MFPLRRGSSAGGRVGTLSVIYSLACNLDGPYSIQFILRLNAPSLSASPRCAGDPPLLLRAMAKSRPHPAPPHTALGI